MMNNSKDVSTPIEYLETPIKSEYDKKDYKCLILPNGLKLLLVSDCKTSFNTLKKSLQLEQSEQQQADDKLSAVALIVDVGAFSQPRGYQGLAHFLEHMLFMGSKKYPLENSFDKHLTKYGGCNNAMTDSEITMYYFEVPEKHLDSSMDHLVAQLKEPLLLEESMTREREAIESEYQLIVNNDYIRREVLMQSLANDNFPHNAFTWGNLKSLKEDIESEQELNRNLREFYNRHYSAHRMYACIQSQLPLDELEQMSLKHLLHIESNQLPGLDFTQYNYREAFKREFFEEVFFIKPIANINNLDLTWVLPPTLEFYKCKPDDLLTYLIGYEGEGSLCAYLRKRLWALQVMAGSDPNPMFTLFNISITLTELGFQNLDQVLIATFAFVKLFHSAAELKNIYEEISFIKASNFRFASEISPGEYVQYLVKCCKYYHSKDILTGPLLYYQFDEDQIQNLILHLNEFRFNISLTSQYIYEGVVYDKNEKWFGTQYTSQKMPQKWCDLWHNSPNIKDLYLPKTNPFIAKNFHIFCKEKSIKDFPDAPEKLLQTDTCELWFRQDDRFLLPHGDMQFYIKSSLIRKSPRNFVICSLYLDLVQYHLVEELYPATMAGINYQMYCDEKGIVMAVDGYNEKLYMVVEIIIKALITSKDYIKEIELETFKKQHLKNYFNDLIRPETVNADLQAFILRDQYCLMTERLKFIENITLAELQNFAQDFCTELYVQALVQGNLEKETAYKVLNTVMGNLNCEKIKEKYYLEDHGTEIPLGCHKIMCNNLNPKDCNTIVTNFYQIGPRSLRHECIVSLILKILEAPLYDVLRTKEQLGYSVCCYSTINHGVIGYTIYVCSQETKHTAFQVEERIETFRLGITKLLNQLSLEDFRNFKTSLIKLKEIKDITLYEEVSRNWNEIISEEYIFQRTAKQIEILNSLEKQDILDFWLENEAKNLRKLSVQVIGTNTIDDSSNQSVEDKMNNNNLVLKFLADDDKNCSCIVNLDEFKNKLKVYPVIKTKI